MQISIKYEASWRNSFLSGSNNETLPIKGRDFLGSMTSLKERNNQGGYSNFIKREVSLNTVMGILNRLIGDQRKLYQSRARKDYFFSELEKHITFQDYTNSVTDEVVYIRNITGSTDQNSFTGMVKATDPAFSSNYSNELWSILILNIEDLCKFILDKNYSVSTLKQFDPIGVLQRLEELNKLKPVEITHIQNVMDELKIKFPDVPYKITDKGIKPIELYCSALYLQISRLSNKYNLSTMLAKKGGITGVSKRGFTPKDFMDRFTSGDKKPIWGNPYLLKERRKGEGEITHKLTKASGTLEIKIDIPREKAKELEEMIESAGVSSFYLGKKGLAYVEEIII